MHTSAILIIHTTSRAAGRSRSQVLKEKAIVSNYWQIFPAILTNTEAMQVTDKRQYRASNNLNFAWCAYQRGLFDTTRSNKKTSVQLPQGTRAILAKNAARSLQPGNICGSTKSKSTPTNCRFKLSKSWL
jgi:hypothetical protein